MMDGRTQTLALSILSVSSHALLRISLPWVKILSFASSGSDGGRRQLVSSRAYLSARRRVGGEVAATVTPLPLLLPLLLLLPHPANAAAVLVLVAAVKTKFLLRPG